MADQEKNNLGNFQNSDNCFNYSAIPLQSNKLNILQPPTPEASNSIQAPEPEVPVPEVPVPQVAKSSCGPEAQPEPKQVPTALTALPNQVRNQDKGFCIKCY